MSYMFVNQEKKIAREWEKYRGFTVRPLPSTVQYYQQIIQSQLSEKTFLMYGGTPEIRSLFQKFNCDVTIVDQSEKMVKAMGLLTDHQKYLSWNEKLITSDWLDQYVSHACVDFMIGDDAINMVSWDHFDMFLSNAYRRLSPKGVFVCHLLVKPDEKFINQRYADVVREFKQGRIKSKYDLASRLNFICYDKKTYAMGWQKTIEQIGKEKLNQLKPDLDFIDTFYFCNSIFYCPPQVEFEKLVKKYFTIEEIFYPHEHDYCLFEPVYLLKKGG